MAVLKYKKQEKLKRKMRNVINMKVFLKTFLALSIILVIMIIMKLADVYTSLKYEVDEPRATQKIGEALDDKEKYLKTFIMWLWITLSYLTINVVALFYNLFPKPGASK